AALEQVIEKKILTALKYAGVILEAAASAIPGLQQAIPLFEAIQNVKDREAVEKEVQGTMRRLEEVSKAIRSCRQQLEMGEVNIMLSDLQKKLQYHLNALETLIKADPKDEEAVQKFKTTFMQYDGERNLFALQQIMKGNNIFGNSVLKVYKTHCNPEEKKQGCLRLICMFYNLMIIDLVYQRIFSKKSWEAIQDACNKQAAEFNEKIKKEMAEDTSPQ
uniref:Rapunzel 5 n=1 Tax=Lepisosteus oculatus TaxID=7918 RepID=W5NMD4_LEPOC